MTENEKGFIVAMMQEYSKIHEKLDSFDRRLDEIESKGSKTSLEGDIKEIHEEINIELEKLDIFRGVEKDFWNEIENKYGPGEFYPDLLEYKPKKK